MALQGYQAEVKVSGAPVSFTAEPMVSDDKALEFLITDHNKQIWDRSATIAVERSTDGETWAAVAEQEYQLNRLEGKVTFFEAQEGSVIRVSGQYVPVTKAAGAYEYTYTLESENQTIPEFNSSFMKRVQGKKDITGSLAKWFDMSSLFMESLQQAKPVVLEFFAADKNQPDMRVWALLSSVEISASQESVMEESIEFEAVADKEGRVVSFG